MASSTDRHVDRTADRLGRRLLRPVGPFLLLACLLVVAGIVLIIFTSGWGWAMGIALVALSGPPAVVGLALGAAGVVARWSARDKPFA
jgi:MFS family permease